MPASGSSIFSDADSYEASLRDILDLLIMRPFEFPARLTWIELPVLRLLRAREVFPRVAYVRLPPEQVFVTFPTHKNSLLISDEIELKYGDMVLHSPGEHLYQRTIGACDWASISLPFKSLLQFGRTIADREIALSSFGRILRPRLSASQRLLRLHAQAGRIAETNLPHIGNKEVARALEQDLIWALVTCLTNGLEQEGGRPRISLSIQLEAIFAAHPHRLKRTRDICGALGISEQTLRASCSKLLGMGPGRYQRLRRLKLLRIELMRANPETLDCTEVIKRFGFISLHSFVTEYWNAYGEMPPIPPRSTVRQ